MHALHGHLCPGQEKKGGGKREGPSALAGIREYKQSNRLVAGGGCYGVMEFGMSHGIKPKRKYMRI